MDPIANFLTRIRNAYLAGKADVVVPHSNLKESMSTILSDHGFVGEVTVDGKIPHKTITLILAYHKDTPLLEHIERISKPSVRIYVTADKIPSALSGKGLTILSTSQGLMTGKDARKKNLGGEVICKLW